MANRSNIFRNIALAFVLALISCNAEQIFLPSSYPSVDPTERWGNEYLFDMEDIPVLTIEVPLSEWNRLLSLYDKDNHTKESVHCDAVLKKQGRIYRAADSGLRLKGQTSRRRPEGEKGQMHTEGQRRYRHVHFGLNFRHFHPSEKGHDLKGVHRINLKYFKEDRSYVRETYGFDLLRRFGVWTALNVSYCRLYLHIEGDTSPVYYGVYLMEEAVDDEFLECRTDLFGGDNGFLWRCSPGSDLKHCEDWRFDIDRNRSNEPIYELKTGKESFSVAYAQIQDFIYKLNKLEGEAFKTWISEVCDVPFLLKMEAVNVAVGHWDEYWNNTNNYYLYFNSRNTTKYKVYMITIDYDNTLGTCMVLGAQSDAGHQDPFHWGMRSCPLFEKILSIPEYRNLYVSYLKELCSEEEELFDYASSVRRIREWQNLVAPYLENATFEDQVIQDRPAAWSNHSEYRILENNGFNWFKIKSSQFLAL